MGLFGSIVPLLVIGGIIWAVVALVRRRGQEEGEPGIGTLRRLYYYGLAFVGLMLSASGAGPTKTNPVEPKVVAIALFDTYLIGVELAGFLLLGGLIGAYHIGRRDPRKEETAA